MPNDAAYSPLKLFHHRDKIDAMKAGEQPVPAQVQLILSDLCNHSCNFCAYRLDGYNSNQLFTLNAPLAKFGHNNPVRMIPFAKAIEIVDDAAAMGIHAFQMTGGGEPTVHPQHLEIFERVLSHGMDLALVSNGAVFREATDNHRSTVDVLLDARWVRFSIDAGRPETYAATRQISETAWDKTWDNVRSLVTGRAARLAASGESEVVIGIGYVVTKENWREVIDCVRIARDVGVDNVRISAMFQQDDTAYFDGFYEECRELCHDAESYSTDTFKVFNRFGDRVGDLAQHHPEYEFCGYQMFNMYIGGDLNIYRCCVTSYNTQGLVGSLKNQTFAEWWASDERKAAYQNFDARGCPRCMFNNINRNILYAIDSNPPHVNFV